MMDMPGREATATTPRLGVSTTAIAQQRSSLALGSE